MFCCQFFEIHYFFFLGGKKRNIAFRRQRMQIDEPVPPSEISSYPGPQPDDPYIADLLHVADNRCIKEFSVGFSYMITWLALSFLVVGFCLLN